jgi:hypothetical protein
MRKHFEKDGRRKQCGGGERVTCYYTLHIRSVKRKRKTAALLKLKNRKRKGWELGPTDLRAELDGRRRLRVAPLRSAGPATE